MMTAWLNLYESLNSAQFTLDQKQIIKRVLPNNRGPQVKTGFARLVFNTFGR